MRGFFRALAPRMTVRSTRAAALIGALCVVATGCGGSSKQAPTQQDAETIGTSVSDIIYQCQSVAAGYVASPDDATLARDVGALLKSDRRVRPDASFAIKAASGPSLTTTLRRELALAEANLTPSCSRGEARRLRSGVG